MTWTTKKGRSSVLEVLLSFENLPQDVQATWAITECFICKFSGITNSESAGKIHGYTIATVPVQCLGFPVISTGKAEWVFRSSFEIGQVFLAFGRDILELEGR